MLGNKEQNAGWHDKVGEILIPTSGTFQLATMINANRDSMPA